MSIQTLPRKQNISFPLIRNNYHAFSLVGLGADGKPLSLAGARLLMHVKSTATEAAPVIQLFDSDSEDSLVKIPISDLLHTDGQTYVSARARLIFTEAVTESPLTAAQYFFQIDYYTAGSGNKYTIFDGTINITEQMIEFPFPEPDPE